MNPLRLVFIAAALVLAAAIAWALATSSFSASFAKIANDPWGLVTLIDLYCAFLVAGCMLWRFEPSRSFAIVLIVLMLGLGSLVPLLWLAFRGAPLLLAGRLGSAPSPKG